MIRSVLLFRSGDVVTRYSPEERLSVSSKHHKINISIIMAFSIILDFEWAEEYLDYFIIVITHAHVSVSVLRYCRREKYP